MRETLAKGIVGIAAPISGAAVSISDHVETWLRISSLVVGIAVGIVSLYYLINPRKQKQ